ncbi:MAG: MFS transporter, partial [Dehalococcoidia bacterium]
TAVGVTAALVQGFLFGILARRFGERRLLVWGAFGMVAGVGVVPWLSSSAALYAWTIVLAFANSLFAPAATGLVSAYAGAAEQGTVLGAAQAIAALGRTTGPPAIGAVYDAVSPVGAFVVAALGMVAAALAANRLEDVAGGTSHG